MLSPHNICDVLSLVTNEDLRDNMHFLVSELSYINLVIQSFCPKEDYSLREFETRSKKLQLFLLEKFSWAGWPDYLHLALAHTVEILQATDSIGRYSAQSKEAKNKGRFQRKASITDVIGVGWGAWGWGRGRGILNYSLQFLKTASFENLFVVCETFQGTLCKEKQQCVVSSRCVQ